ncbi:hypothetical protein [Rhodococcus sp. H29-C3]|uniref:hypothetical protein n=1 Tax=Rhodococcus sp. H29-C3 TaxID=3046307 RepID=UPI0024BADE2C|nr:hypothetical protein [Rhodococcus sp. H29-C3]MDJ0362739.1 hypothetical protein [Rhodococcus sp. H29-C3]
MVSDVGGGTAIPLEADPAAMRSTSSELQTYVYSLTDSASTVNFDVQSVAGSQLASVLAQVRLVVTASVEAPSKRLKQLSESIDDCASGYEQTDNEFASSLLGLLPGGEVGRPSL